jgi:hypothetical protein
MDRTKPPKVIIDKDGWMQVQIEEDFLIPVDVRDQTAFLNREKIMRYINNHPERMYHYMVGDQEFTVDCKCSEYLIRKLMTDKGGLEEDIILAQEIGHQLRYFYGKLTQQTKLAFAGKSQAGGVLEAKADELLDLFGSLHSIEDVCRIVVEQWGFHVHPNTIRSFYTRNLKEIERLRDQYAADYSDVALTKKRARMDKLSIIFYTYFNKWYKNPQLDYANMLLKLLEQIRKEAEGEIVNVNVQGQINIDLTLEVNKTLYEAYKRVPVNNLILAMVAAKKGIDPTKLMTQLTSSYYKSLTGFGTYKPEEELVHPVDLTYNWNEIERKHRTKDKSIIIEEAQIVESTGSLKSDAEVNTMKNKLLELLDKDRSVNSKRITK